MPGSAQPHLMTTLSGFRARRSTFPSRSGQSCYRPRVGKAEGAGGGEEQHCAGPDPLLPRGGEGVQQEGAQSSPRDQGSGWMCLHDSAAPG